MNKITGLILGLVPFVAIRILLFLRIDNYIATWETVSSANIVISRLHTFGQLVFGSLHPFYRLALKVFLMFSDNPLVFAPLFNFLLSVLLAVLFYLYVYCYFGKVNAIVSLFLFSFVPVLSLQAVLSTEIALMQLLLVASLYWFKRYLDTRNKIQLLLFLVVFNLGHLTRFESWLLIPVFMLFLFKDLKSSFGVKLAICFSMLIVPIQAFIWKDPIAEIKGQAFESLIDISRIAESGYEAKVGFMGLFNWFFVMAQSVGELWLICVLCGLFYCVYKKKEMLYSASIGFVLFVFCCKSAKGEIIPHPRYITTVVLLLLPYFYYLLENIATLLKSKVKRIIFIWSLVCLVCSTMFFRTIDVYGRPLFSLKTAITESSEYLERDLALFDIVREYVPKEANVFVDTDYYSKDYDNIIAYGIRENSNIMSFEGRSFLDSEINLESMRQFTKERIMTNLPIYILLSDNGMFESLYGKNVSFLAGSKKLTTYKDWRILYLE